MNRRLASSWIVPGVLAGLAAIPLLVMWLSDDIVNRQERNLRTLLVLLLFVIVALGWFAFLAPLSGRLRAAGVGGVVALVVLLVTLFQIEGVSGDLVPIYRFRWSEPTKRSLPALETSASSTAPAPVPSAEFPQFLGPARTGLLPDVSLAEDWEAQPPRVVWRRDVGPGWSGIAVGEGLAITQEQRDADELVVAYDLATGSPVWQHRDKARYATTLGGIGPRATPTIREGRIYAQGATGILNCLDAATGEAVWSVNITRNTGAVVPEWGFAGSPLVDGARVIVQAGGRSGALLAAYDRTTGKPLWTGGTGKPSYASLFIAELDGRRQIISLNHASCTGHDPETGGELWRFEWRGAQPKAAQPVVVGGDRVVISAGYGVGADAFRVTNSGVEPLWKTLHLKSKFATFVHREGHLYGLNDGRLTCLDIETGRRTWRGERYGHGQLLLLGNRLLIMAEQGEVVLVAADPSEFRPLTSVSVFTEKTWNTPALAGNYLLVRNDREMACLELPLKK